MVDRARWVPADIDITRPNPARVYDYFLGGTHNLAADREVGDRAIAAAPDIPRAARSNRAFLGRAVRYLTAHGVHQFIDLGSGIPTEQPTHEVAAGARVVYVDNDPVAAAHSDALLRAGGVAAERSAVLRADLRDPATILDSAVVTGTLDRAEPVGLLMLAVLHFVSDQDDPAGIVAALLAGFGPGSYVAISHATTDIPLDPEYVRRPEPKAYLRTAAEIRALFGAAELVPPGLVKLDLWRPDEPVPEEVRLGPAVGLAGVARTG